MDPLSVMRWRVLHWRWLALLVASFHLCSAKVHTVKFNLGPRGDGSIDDWLYITKFGYGLGLGRYKVSVKMLTDQLVGPRPVLVLETYLDEAWPEAKSGLHCAGQEHVRSAIKVKTTLPSDKTVKNLTGTVRHDVRTHYWYFALSDCNHTLEKSYPFELTMELLQEGGSHFGVEMGWSLPSQIALLLALTASLVLFWHWSLDFYRRTESIHPVVWTLLAVLLFQFAAECMGVWHLCLYWSNGQGSHLLEVLGDVCNLCSQVIQTSLLLVIAHGYTLTQSMLGDLKLVLLISGGVALAHIGLVVLDKAQPDEVHKYTDHEGLAGTVFLLLQLGLYAWFLMAGWRTKSAGGYKLKAFLRSFMTAASIYFLSYPATLTVARFFAPYLRQTVIDVGLLLAQLGTNVWLTTLVLGRGAYFEASSLSASPLPGGNSPTFFNHNKRD